MGHRRPDVRRLAAEIPPREASSPWPGHEHARGYGVMSLPFASGHVLAMRAFPESDFGPWAAVWHRGPGGGLSIHVDAPTPEAGCPRYFGPVLERSASARIRVSWPGPSTLRVWMNEPALDWTVELAQPPALGVVNAVSARLPRGSWRLPALVRARERLAEHVLGLGPVTLAVRFPAGMTGTMMPSRVYRIAASTAMLEGVDLGAPVQLPDVVRVGELAFPRRPTFALGEAAIAIPDPAEHALLRDRVRALRTGGGLS